MVCEMFDLREMNLGDWMSFKKRGHIIHLYLKNWHFKCHNGGSISPLIVPIWSFEVLSVIMRSIMDH